MKVLMGTGQIGEGGILRVVEAYRKEFPKYGVELVPEDSSDYDLIACHAGYGPEKIDVAILHGMYFSKDYKATDWEYAANKKIVQQLRWAKQITVPSNWVAETFQRDMRINPTVVPHGIYMNEWKPGTNENYVLYNKNRDGEDFCNSNPLKLLAERNPDTRFLSTFCKEPFTPNVKITGAVHHDVMIGMIQNAGVYLATTKETFGIGILEAMACGIPVLGYAHGGILDLVKHGVNGYLAEPGNYDDLNGGLQYCLKYRDRLGANGREMAKVFTWDKAAKILVSVFEKALIVEPPSVAVIIPCYKYANVLGRAIKSVLAQTIPPEEIVVVDDGTPDDSVKEVMKDFPQVKFIQQPNSGVAAARNNGILETKSKYIVCLDADDTIAPEFVETCVRGLENDRSIYIAYTRLMTVDPTGYTQESRWPREYKFDEQLKKNNQVPTCCMFRRTMWERLGGYRQRYAPKGAGCEDAEFWLRAGAYGMGAKIVDDRPLFIYSAGTGQTFHDKDYYKIDWTCWHPWTKDFNHPLASLATPKHISHPVRQYDEPTVSVVIPVGPGHQWELINALDSLEAQTYRKWEVIVTNDTGKSDWVDFYRTAYPYIRWVNFNKNKGAGAARNAGVRIARSPFIVYLDADDWLYPEFLEKHLLAWKDTETIIYSDYVGKSTVDDISKLAPDLRGRVYRYENGEAVIGYRAAEFDCERALRQPDENDVYLWCNVTVLIPKKWHDAIGGFDESMVTREDVDYHWRLARAGYCYTRIPEELFVYRFNTGTRREAAYTNRQIAEVLLSYLKDKYAKDKPMGCACRGNKAAGPSPQMISQAQGANTKMMDDDVIMARYLSPNKGSHSVYGPSRTYYGQRSGGETFLVKKEDIALAPHLFAAVEGAVGSVTGPPKEVIPLEAPPDLTPAEPKKRGRPKNK